jgi:pimeloyl-ACP methyl ester carboxylesterase
MATTRRKMKTIQKTQHKTQKIDNLNIFYREAGAENAIPILLLHGFPSSSHMFRDLMADLKNDYRLLAPDYPGFGNSDMPFVNEFEYNFEKLTEIIEKFIISLNIEKFYMYMQDYGGPIGMRLAVKHPEWIAGLIIQNSNAYMEGVGEALAKPVMPFWKNRNAETEMPLRGLLSLEGTKLQYQAGTKNSINLNPDAWTFDQLKLDRPGNTDIQLALLYDYQNNVPQFEVWQNYLRIHQPFTLIAWGAGDPFFTVAGAKAYLKDVPKAELHLLDTGHFALEDHHEEIATLIKNFIK